MGVEDQLITEKYALYLGDAVDAMGSIPNDSIHIIIESPPFAYKSGALYQYSSSPRDLSNAPNYAAFFDHYDYVLREEARITMPGRMNLIHCMDTPSGNSGKDYLVDFPGDLIEAHVRCRNPKCQATEFDKRRGFCGHGFFDYIGRYDIWKEPLGVRNRLMIKDLAHQTVVEDASKCSVAGFDYLLAFRKKGENPIPVGHPTGLHEYYGERQIPTEVLHYKGYDGKQTENIYSHWIWRQYASSNWDDVRIENVLPYREARDDEDEKHVHALQLDVIMRGVTLWTNPGEILWTSFMGVGSEVYSAVKLGRRAMGSELKASYFRQAIKNLAELGKPQPKQITLQEMIELAKKDQAA